MSYAFSILVPKIRESIQASASACTSCGVDVYCVNSRKDAGKMIFWFLNRAADNDPDPVENIAVNPVTVDTAALTVTDDAGVTHHVFPRRIFEANEALKAKGAKKRLCPCCGYPSGCCSN